MLLITIVVGGLLLVAIAVGSPKHRVVENNITTYLKMFEDFLAAVSGRKSSGTQVLT